MLHASAPLSRDIQGRPWEAYPTLSFSLPHKGIICLAVQERRSAGITSSLRDPEPAAKVVDPAFSQIQIDEFVNLFSFYSFIRFLCLRFPPEARTG